MKKIYIFSVALLFAGFTMGQGLMKTIKPAPKNMNVAEVANFDNSSAQFKAGNPSTQAVIWSETFTGGIPVGWTVTDVAGNGNWVYTTTATNPIFDAAKKLNSTTAATGYMLFDSDGFGDDSKAEEAFFKSPSINLTGYSNVALQFQQEFYQYYSTTTVIVSDGTNSQTFTINNGSVNPNVAVNAASANPETVVINISAIAGNKPNVTVEFHWVGNWDYWWQVDDVAITEAASNDLALSEYYFYGYEDSTATRYYSMIPSRQAQNDTILFGAAIFNQGGSAQPNAKLGVNVTGPSTFSGTSPSIPSLAVSSTDSVNLSSFFFATGDTGTYNITYTVSSDSVDNNLTNNTATSSFQVTDTVYARDNNAPASGGWFGSGSTYIIGNVFEIMTPDTATSISMLVGDFVNPAYDPDGETFSLLLYDFSVDPPTIIASNEFYVIQTGDLGKWLTLSIPPTPLAPGWYMAAFETFGDTVLFLNGGQTTPPLTVFVDVDKTGTWSYLSSTPFVRLNTKGPFDACAATLSTAITNVACNGGNTGAINLTVNGGSAPFTYNWSNGAAIEDLSGLVSGSYSVTVTFGGTCSVTGGPFTVTQPATALSATTSSTGTCTGSSNGTATATPSGGTGPYSFLWSDGQTGQTANNLAAGSFSVTVTDSKGCTVTGSVTITAVTISATATSVNTTCGNNNGSAMAAATGGTPSYTYVWSNAQTTASISGLAAGTYTVTVTDSKGCSGTASANIGSSTPVSVTTSSTDAACGQNDGSASVVSPTGTDYSYMWSNSQTTAQATGLGAGTYVVTVTDNLGGCSGTASASVNNTGAATLATTKTDVVCNGATTGSIDLTVTGGTGPFTYLWSNGAVTEDITGIGAGTYLVTVTGNGGCLSSTSTILTEPTLIVIAANGIDETDPGNNGAVNVIVSGGTPPYQYIWSNGATTEDITGLVGNNTYTVSVTDGNGCIMTSATTIGTTVNIKEAGTDFTFALFPNPNKGIFNVQFKNGNGQYNLEITNVIGQVIFSERVAITGNSVRPISLSDFGQGIYFLNVKGNNVNRTQKIIFR